MLDLYTLFRSTTGVTTDSRKVEEGQLFFALRGPNFDGNAYAADALDKGAAYAVVDDPSLSDRPGMVVVPNSLQALQELGRHHRRQFNFPVVGITGSNGKTTTKELITAVLRQRFQVHATPGNFNNHIGVPLTLLQMAEDTEVAVIEMGANHQGEIAALSAIAEPTHGLITNIGKAHLEGFGGLEGVKKGKSELYRFLAASGGVAFVNRDEPFLTGLSAPVRNRVFYRTSEKPSATIDDYEMKLVREDPTLVVGFLDEQGELVHAFSQLSGRYNLGNIATAVALGRYFKVSAQSIVDAIEQYRPANNRSEWTDWKGNQVFLDAYNANPTSMRLTLEWFARQPERPKTAVLGSMLELGPYADKEHQAILDWVLEQEFDRLYFIGEGFGKLITTLPEPHRYFPDVEALRRFWESDPPAGDFILFKGSRGFSLERLLED